MHQDSCHVLSAYLHGCDQGAIIWVHQVRCVFLVEQK